MTTFRYILPLKIVQIDTLSLHIYTTRINELFLRTNYIPLRWSHSWKQFSLFIIHDWQKILEIINYFFKQNYLKMEHSAVDGWNWNLTLFELRYGIDVPLGIIFNRLKRMWLQIRLYTVRPWFNTVYNFWTVEKYVPTLDNYYLKL